MVEFLVGSGLAAAAGLNAWMPLFVLGLLDRFLPVIQLPSSWSWLSSDAALWITGILLVVEIVADKIPAIDSVNDVLQTVVRPASGGIVFGAGASAEAVRVDDPSLFSGGTWVPIAIGVVIALAIHALKASVRPVANVATAGLAAPVLSAGEDVSAFVLILAAIFVPALAGVLIVGLVFAAIVLLRRRRRRASAERSTAATR
ncbi:DUF4126 domain-containing protein [Microbacterium sp. VKM Ac-2870]|uniref:DUF4126 domain-containing protein n=1 Tax=Microbacterium sp. VKM Ac-2870 TaxID=2783825 RepID=UPI00188A8802|nr:DUF4126 domain-containing protein [Microbacterium sp. VKM Ac-2870]MBF4561065.1 DUF4126 domain-containing protein [Microbacterium sp. VKM Ac-2870]